jgi:hypothetical protein
MRRERDIAVKKCRASARQLVAAHALMLAVTRQIPACA